MDLWKIANYTLNNIFFVHCDKSSTIKQENKYFEKKNSDDLFFEEIDQNLPI